MILRESSRVLSSSLVGTSFCLFPDGVGRIGIRLDGVSCGEDGVTESSFPLKLGLFQFVRVFSSLRSVRVGPSFFSKELVYRNQEVNVIVRSLSPISPLLFNESYGRDYLYIVYKGVNDNWLLSSVMSLYVVHDGKNSSGKFCRFLDYFSFERK